MMMRSFEVAVNIPFTAGSPHLVRVTPREWDEYDIERVRVHDSVSDDEIRRALASHNELRVALAHDAHAQRVGRPIPYNRRWIENQQRRES